MPLHRPGIRIWCNKSPRRPRPPRLWLRHSPHPRGCRVGDFHPVNDFLKYWDIWKLSDSGGRCLILGSSVLTNILSGIARLSTLLPTEVGDEAGGGFARDPSASQQPAGSWPTRAQPLLADLQPNATVHLDAASWTAWDFARAQLTTFRGACRRAGDNRRAARRADDTLSLWTTSRDLSRPTPTTTIPCRSKMPLRSMRAPAYRAPRARSSATALTAISTAAVSKSPMARSI